MNSLKNLLVVCAGLALFILLVVAVYRYLPGQGPGTAPAPRENEPAGQEAGGKADRGIVTGEIPVEPELIPLKRSLAEVERLYGNKMTFMGATPISSGQLQGGTVKTYMTGTATDELTLKEDRLYKRTLAFNIAEIGADVSSFCSSVYLLALYQTAYDQQYSLETVPQEIRAKAWLFGAKCAALRASGEQPAEHYEIDGDYVFACHNPDNTRLKFEVSSEGLFRAEKTGGQGN